MVIAVATRPAGASSWESEVPENGAACSVLGRDSGGATTGTVVGGSVAPVVPGAAVAPVVALAVGCVVVGSGAPGPAARAMSMRPTPNDGSRPTGPRSRAVASSRSTAASGARPSLRRMASAPDTCGAAIDVPARHAYWSC